MFVYACSYVWYTPNRNGSNHEGHTKPHTTTHTTTTAMNSHRDGSNHEEHAKLQAKGYTDEAQVLHQGFTSHTQQAGHLYKRECVCVCVWGCGCKGARGCFRS